MQFSEIQARVAQETGLSTTDDATMIKAWINGAYQQVSGFFDWPWLLTNFTIQTEADKTTGTVSVNAGGTALTFSVAPSTNSVATYYMIQFTGTGATDDWYLISAHTANTTSATISVPYVGSTNYTSGTLVIRKVYYALPSTVDRLIDLRQSVTKTKIELTDPRAFDTVLPDPNNTGTPAVAYLTGMKNDNSWLMSFYPLPSAIINVQGRGFIRITELSADADLPLIPAKWHNILVFLALALYGHDYIDDNRVQTAAARAKELLQEMLKQFNPLPGQLTVIQPWDMRGPRGIGVRLPSNYPFPWGL